MWIVVGASGAVSYTTVNAGTVWSELYFLDFPDLYLGILDYYKAEQHELYILMNSSITMKCETEKAIITFILVN